MTRRVRAGCRRGIVLLAVSALAFVVVPTARAAGDDAGLVRPAGDFDGDGLHDLLTTRQSSGPDDIVTLRGVRGVDGTELWTRSEPFGSYSFAQPARLGPDGRDGVLYVNGTWIWPATFGVAVITYLLRLVAISGSGKTLWERTLSGTVYSTLAGNIGDAIPFFGGVADAAPGPAQDVLVQLDSFTTYNVLDAPARYRTVANVLSGADGSDVSASSLEAIEHQPLLRPLPDLDGDGLDDYLLSVYREHLEMPGLLHARRGTDGAELWHAQERLAYDPPFTAAGDATGDGVTDLLVQPGVSFSERGESSYLLMDGATGRVLWRKAAGSPRPLGDVTGDGRADLGATTFGYDASSYTAGYTAFDHAGAPVYATEYRVAIPPQGWIVLSNRVWPSIGDVDGDGAPDAAHEFVLVDPDAEQFLTERGAVSGRTGAKLWSGHVLEPVFASVDGAGDDLVSVTSAADGTSVVVAARDGATGAPLWATTLAGASGSNATHAADVDGDGRAEVVLNVSDRAGRFGIAVLRAVDGTVMWSSGP
jgi:hypothetical protein